MFKNTEGDFPYVLDMKEDNEGESGEDGKFTISLDMAKYEIRPGRYNFDLNLVLGSGSLIPLANKKDCQIDVTPADIEGEPNGEVFFGADYPVEVGDKDGWHYKKWASGDVECWRKKTSNTLCEWDSNSVVGSVQLPFDFVGTIYPFCSGYQEGVSSSAINMVSVDGSNKNVSAYMSISKNQYDQGKYCRFNFLVKGRWK